VAEAKRLGCQRHANTSIPGEKEQNHDFEVHAMTGRIVGARIGGAP
jgi:hypothetical protein